MATVHFYIPKDPKGIHGYQALQSTLRSILVVNPLKISVSVIFLKFPKDKIHHGR